MIEMLNNQFFLFHLLDLINLFTNFVFLLVELKRQYLKRGNLVIPFILDHRDQQIKGMQL